MHLMANFKSMKLSIILRSKQAKTKIAISKTCRKAYKQINGKAKWNQDRSKSS